MIFKERQFNNKSGGGGKFFKAVAIFIFLIIMVVSFNMSSFAGSTASLALGPVMKFGDFFYQKISFYPSLFADKADIAAENANLTIENERLKNLIFDFEAELNENMELRSALHLKPQGQLISSRVIAHAPKSPIDTMFIDKGTADGVNAGAKVLASDRVLIGTVTESSREYSVVKLSSFSGSTNYAELESNSEPIEIVGTGGGVMKARIPRNVGVAVGDKVFMSDSVNYVFGIVGVIQENSEAGFKDVFITLPITVSNIDTVFVEPILK